MFNTPKLLLTLAIAACCSYNAYTQTDTSTTDLNLGRIKLKKDFTQSITIQGEQLEKMPFTSLSEAINAWTYGIYASARNINYVVDGIIINDVNAWSVYDIKEVTLVQNALTQVNGADRQQLLVVVTTRKGGAGKQGMTVAGQSFLVKTDQASSSVNPPTSSESNFFHQYQVSAWRNDKNIQYGVSANYLRDVSPALKSPGTTTKVPSNYDRFRLNGWLTARLGSAHDLSLAINVVPQVGDFESSFSNYMPSSEITIYNKVHTRQTVFNPSIGLRSRLGAGFTNEFTASYAFFKKKGKIESETFTNSPSQYNQQINNNTKNKQVLLMDQVTYHASLDNNWSIEPSVNFMFRYIKYKYETTAIAISNGSNTSISNSAYQQEGRIFLLTPAVNLYYRNSFHIQGGLLGNLSKTYGQKIKKVLPFASTSVDVLRLSQPANPTSLKFFVSFAETNNLGDMVINPEVQNTNTATLSPVTGPVLLGSLPPDDSYWVWQAGTRLALLNNKVSFNYLFERRNFTAEVYVQVPGGTGVDYRLLYPDLTSSTHHIGINATVLNKNSLYWLTGINATSIKSKSKESLDFYNYHTVTGDFNSNKTSWTGGWINRFSWKQFSAGADLVYYFNPDQLPTIPGNSKVNAISLSNVYVGYQLNLKGTKGLELYAACRNLQQDKEVKITGTRKYYGLGCKATL